MTDTGQISSNKAMKDASQTSLPSFNVPSQALFGSYCHDSQTPVNLTNENETLEDLIRYSGLSSQTNSDSIDLNSVKNKAELIGIPWDRLNDAQKCQRSLSKCVGESLNVDVRRVVSMCQASILS